MKKILYDGSSKSVRKIMDMIGTMGVCNFEGKLYIDGKIIPKGEYIFEKMRDKK